ncbi:bifunctional riboflavin kinase/FAD synthetase [Candidatus Nitrospira bockiana]
MKIITGLARYEPKAYPVLTIGNYDGVHRGHVALLTAVVETAKRHGGTPIVLTFDPHPLTVLSPSTRLSFLTPLAEKFARFEELGIEEVVCLAFDPELAALTPEEFVRRVLRDGIGVKELFVGEHFAFGVRRTGRVSDLVRLSDQAGFRVHAVPPVKIDGEVISSTRIRLLIQAGDVRTAAKYLGRAYELAGTVVPGAQRGQRIGWPTANLPLPADRVIPADGVYATSTVWQGRAYDSVAYIGTRPTFGPGERLLEVYLLDEQVNLYDQEIRVRFVDRVRGDLVFESPEELSARIDLDVRQARKSLETTFAGD